MIVKKKIKQQDFWEKLFPYPSFNHRFGFWVVIISLFFLIVGFLLVSRFKETTDRIELIILLVQSATLIFGIIAAYYALRQLVETKFEKLDENGMLNLKRQQYSRAIRTWNEAFYIRPESETFMNLLEAILLLGDFDQFDERIGLSEEPWFKKKIFLENPEKLTFLYLKAIRHLLVKNLGEAEMIITKIIKLRKETDDFVNFNWNFTDLTKSVGYKALSGDSKAITDNLILYLKKSMSPEHKTLFEGGNFSASAPAPVPTPMQNG